MNSNGLKKGCVVIPDNFPQFSTQQLSVPDCYADDLDCIMIPQGLIVDRTKRIADEINDTIGDAPLTVLCVLKGGFKFFQNLTEELGRARSGCKHPLQFDFIRLKSYVNTQSSGTIEMIGGDHLSDVRGRDVLVVEDIIDSGITMQYLLEFLRSKEPRSVRVAGLLVKRAPKSTGYWPDFAGFEIPDRFVIGYGLDFNEYGRDLNHVCVISQRGIEKYGAKTNQRAA